MLVHVGQPEVAARIHNAWLATIEDGIHTGDIHREGTSQARVGTAAFADAVIERLGTSPTRLAAVSYGQDHAPFRIPEARRLPPQKKDLVGIDVFVHWASEDADALAERLQAATPNDRATLEMITNRGTKVWPQGLPETFRTDHWRCRFAFRDGGTAKDVVTLLGAFEQAGIDFVKTEHLYNFDGVPGYSLGQGQ
jgi:isocitrate dehydrogenase